MTTTSRRRDQGFTLVEMLIVIVVLGVLATIVVFAVRGIRTLAEDNSEAADAKTLETAAEGHMALHGVYADEASLVSAGLLREQSQMFDIDVLDGGEDYQLVPEGTGGGGGGGTGEDTNDDTDDDDGGGPPPEAVPTTYAGQSGLSYGAETSSKKLVIIGNGASAMGQQLWAQITAHEFELADTQVIWMNGVDSVDDVDAILNSIPAPTYVIVPTSVNIGPGGPAGAYVSGTGRDSPSQFWWGYDEGGVGGAIAYYLAHFGG